MAPIQGEPLSFASRAEWRAWLAEHHAAASEARVAIYKKGPLAGGLTLSDVQEEALCFGWVDTTGAAVDDTRWAIRLTPRRAKSEWSISNVRRVERLAQQGLMTEAGWKPVEEARRNGQWENALRVEQTDVVPLELEVALRGHAGLLEAYLSLSHSRRRLILRGLLNAKTDATLTKRVDAVLAEVAALVQGAPASVHSRTSSP
jgi:uncharacterized protein YdeI (YjbR/CyaY-like superfamily)